MAGLDKATNCLQDLEVDWVLPVECLTSRLDEVGNSLTGWSLQHEFAP